MKNIYLLRVTFGLVVAFFQMFEVGAQILPPVTINKNQNFQYSNYQFAPLAVNPALVGSDGLYRFSSMISSKFNDVYRLPSSQLNFSSEYTIIKGFKSTDKVGIGVSADLIGFAGFYPLPKPLPNGTNYSFGAAYHYSLNTAATDFLSFGIQYNSDSRYFVEEPIEPSISSVNPIGDPDIDLFNLQNTTFYDRTEKSNWSVGLLYKSTIGHQTKSFGISTYKLNSVLATLPTKPNLNRYGFNAHGSYDINLYKNISITPGFFYSNFEFSKLLNINTNVSYWINKEKMSKVYLGLGITDIKRTIIYAGGVFRGINLSLAYDINTMSDDQFSSIQSGIELGASYTGLARKNK
ncbi:MAG TPA: type IX secretion system membrane protein PorP/SprF [Saprospiraceae bacterium]|nr:type IX secretion system membrane protein PorP/SprF [Saprospiraceae bacterium]